MIFFESKRCLVREFGEQDLDAVVEYRNNLEWMKYQGFKNHTKAEYRSSLIVPFDIDKGSQLAIIEKSMNVLIGDLYIIKEQNTVHIGYTINPIHSRQGYMKETVIAFIEYIFKNYPTCIIQAETELENIPSKSLLEKLGFSCKGISDDGYVFELTNKLITKSN